MESEITVAFYTFHSGFGKLVSHFYPMLLEVFFTIEELTLEELAFEELSIK
jgi:hypothetical protein